MKVIITMAVFNALQYTITSLESIYKNTDYNFELIIVNNGSNDGTEEYLNWFVKNYPRCYVIHLPKNLGFSSGHNKAFQFIKDNNMEYDYINLLNNDVLVGKHWLNSMVKTSMRDERIGIVGPVSNNAGGTQGIKINQRWTEIDEFTAFADDYREKTKGQMSREGVIVGLCMLITKKCFTECLPFPEKFPMTMFDDNLLCLRALHRGFILSVDRSTVIWHFGQKSFQANHIDMGKKMQEMNEVFKKAWKEEEEAIYGNVES